MKIIKEKVDNMNWTDADSAKAVLEWAEKGLTSAVTKYAKLETEEIGRQAMEKYWTKNNPTDGVGSFGTNPYQEKLRHSKEIYEANTTVIQWRATLYFLKNRICDMIE
jgi:hypothetical protein